MSGSVSDMGNGLRQGRLAALLIAAVVAFSPAAYGQSSALNLGTPGASGSLLPRKAVVPLKVVNRFFAEVTQQASTGRNSTAVGNPKATRSVIYANDDDSKKVTITVDLYRNSRDAWSAFREALQKSEEVPGFKPISIPPVGQRSFAGMVTMGAETHVGLGALDGKLIVGVTLAGFDATPHNIAGLVALARVEDAAAKEALGVERWRH
jgi:hypothetical protein